MARVKLNFDGGLFDCEDYMKIINNWKDVLPDNWQNSLRNGVKISPIYVIEVDYKTYIAFKKAGQLVQAVTKDEVRYYVGY